MSSGAPLSPSHRPPAAPPVATAAPPAAAGAPPPPPQSYNPSGHKKHSSVSSTATSVASAAPPSKAEVERKLSVKLSNVSVPRKPARKGSIAAGGSESDSASAPSSLPPLITLSLGLGSGSAFTASPVGATPSTPHGTHGAHGAHGTHGPHGPLSAIAERRAPNDSTPSPQQRPEDAPEEDESDEDEGANAELERGMDGERLFKSGFLIKKQERRKVWKKKWFVLRSTKLAYYKDNREYSLSRAIELRQIHSVVPVTDEKQKHPFAFAIVTSDRNFMVEALSAEERDDWVRAINERKRMAERESEDAARRLAGQQQAHHQASKPMPVPAPPPDHYDLEPPHRGTWTSTFSSTTAGTSVSPGSASGGYFRSGAPGPSSWHPPSVPVPHAHAHGHGHATVPPHSPSAGVVAHSLGRSASSGAVPPSAAAVDRRLSNPIPIPSLQAKTAQLSHNPPPEHGGQPAQAPAPGSLSPPTASAPHFVSSDEDEPYFSDPNAAWPAASDNAPPDAAAVAHAATPDPNQVILAAYLMKKSRKTTRIVWRKRWFILTPSAITYTKSHMDERALRVIPISTVLDVFSIDPDDDDGDDDDSSGPEWRARSPPRHPGARRGGDGPAGHRREEHVVRIVCTKRRYDLCAPSEEEEIKWIAAIRALVNRCRGGQPPQAVCGTSAGVSSTAPSSVAGGGADATAPVPHATSAQAGGSPTQPGAAAAGAGAPKPPLVLPVLGAAGPGLPTIPSSAGSVATDSTAAPLTPRRALA